MGVVVSVDYIICFVMSLFIKYHMSLKTPTMDIKNYMTNDIYGIYGIYDTRNLQ